MHYTLFELERIEKILQAKLAAASEVYMEAEKKIRQIWVAKVNGSTTYLDPTSATGYDTKALDEAWGKFREEDDNLRMLHEEVELFKEGVESLYSYWNYAVEIFIDNMRTHISEKEEE